MCPWHDQDPEAIAARLAASRRGGRGRRPKPQRLAATLAQGDFADPNKRSQIFATLKWEVYQGILDPKLANAIVALDGREHGDDGRVAREMLERMEQTQQRKSRLAQPAFELDLPSRFKEQEEPEAKAESEQVDVNAGGEEKAEE